MADLAEVRDDTRYLLQRGLDVLRETRRLGLQVLMESAELSPDRLGEEHISFVIAPRLNALGRLADANVAVEFLTTDDLARARLIAADLEALNSKRKLLCDQVTAAAEAQLQRDPALLETAALVLAGPGWHPGVVGIVASRLVERYGVPIGAAIAALSRWRRVSLARGSARSVAGVNISAAIAAHADLLLGFGGHPMAAGLSLAPDRIPEFRRALSRTVEAMSREAEVTPGLQIDGELPLSDLTLDFAADVERLAPFGPGNPPLTLVSRDLTVRGRAHDRPRRLTPAGHRGGCLGHGAGGDLVGRRGQSAATQRPAARRQVRPGLHRAQQRLSRRARHPGDVGRCAAGGGG